MANLIMKSAVIALMYAAMAVFMLHAVTPHHHHEEVPCFHSADIEPCHSDDHNHDHETCNSMQDNCEDHDSDAEACSLTELVALLPDFQKNELYGVATVPVDLVNDLFASSNIADPEHEIQEHWLIKHEWPDPASNYIFQLSHDHGLRAPPQC